MNISDNKLLIITGTNASGKSGLGIDLAERFGAEIVSADSRQVYRGLDLGSGKVTKEEMRQVPHHLLDVAEPGDFFSLVDYQKLAYEAIDGILKRGNKAFLVGGTGLYINAVADGYNMKDEKPDLEFRRKLQAMSIQEVTQIVRKLNPKALDRLDLHNKRRLERAAERAVKGDLGDRESCPRYETLILGVTWPRDVLYERIRVRLDRRLSEGMIEEVSELRRSGVSDEFLLGLGLEYRYITMYLKGEFEGKQAFYDKLFMEIRHLAKEQMTWFRKRSDIHWIDMTKDHMAQTSELVRRFYES